MALLGQARKEEFKAIKRCFINLSCVQVMLLIKQTSKQDRKVAFETTTNMNDVKMKTII